MQFCAVACFQVNRVNSFIVCPCAVIYRYKCTLVSHVGYSGWVTSPWQQWRHRQHQMGRFWHCHWYCSDFCATPFVL